MGGIAVIPFLRYPPPKSRDVKDRERWVFRGIILFAVYMAIVGGAALAIWLFFLFGLAL